MIRKRIVEQKTKAMELRESMRLVREEGEEMIETTIRLMPIHQIRNLKVRNSMSLKFTEMKKIFLKTPKVSKNFWESGEPCGDATIIKLKYEVSFTR